MKKINLQDFVYLVKTKTDGYGNDYVSEKVQVRAAFFPGTTSVFENGYQQNATYDAHCYFDETDPFILANCHRLEGMYLIANLYGNADAQEWYKIARVQPGVTKITDNIVNNVHTYLLKSVALDEPISS